MSEHKKIKVVLFRDGEWWVAQCLEYDLATQARDYNEVFGKLERLIAGRLAVAAQLNAEPFALLPKAPESYWRMYEKAKPVEAPVRRSQPLGHDAVPDLELRAA